MFVVNTKYLKPISFKDLEREFKLMIRWCWYTNKAWFSLLTNTVPWIKCYTIIVSIHNIRSFSLKGFLSLLFGSIWITSLNWKVSFNMEDWTVKMFQNQMQIYSICSTSLCKIKWEYFIFNLKVSRYKAFVAVVKSVDTFSYRHKTD